MSIREEYWGVPYQIIDGRQTYFDIYEEKWQTELKVNDNVGNALRLKIRERLPDDPPSQYWGWLETDSDYYEMIQPVRLFFDMCFTYGPKAEEDRGRGHAVNLHVELWPE
jgi:hypothetical protein